MEHLIAIARQFIPRGTIAEVREYGRGNVNDTFLVTVAPTPAAAPQAATTRFILQRLNTGVFRQPELVMANLRSGHRTPAPASGSSAPGPRPPL